MIIVGSIALIAGCTAQAKNAKTSTSQAQASIASKVSQNSFNFPKATCGDKLTGDNDTWYPVFVDGGDLETLRHNFCADAKSTVRKDSKVQSVQLASFTSREQAIEFAKAVGGDVGQPSSPNAARPTPQVETANSTSQARTAVIIDPPSNIRTAPNGDVICSVGSRATINIYGSVGSWYYTDACARMGVIHSSQFVISAEETTQPSSESPSSSSYSTQECNVKDWGSIVGAHALEVKTQLGQQYWLMATNEAQQRILAGNGTGDSGISYEDFIDTGLTLESFKAMRDFVSIYGAEKVRFWQLSEAEAQESQTWFSGVSCH